MKTYTLVMQVEADDDVNPAQIREELYDAGSDVPFGFEITDITEVGTESSARTVTIARGNPGSITIGDPSNAQTVRLAGPEDWSQEDKEQYQRTGETPLDRLHRQNLEQQWSGTDRATEK
ncbi:hypothetical protein [Streptomyces sp. NPDC004783]|uniref:hypothetical protein n=1 Tax=Streptomyces sp. NPDC004783 TaxID=3154459 RepID=UPI0033BC5131